MELAKIADYVVGIKDTYTGIELTMERTVKLSQKEIAKALYDELGYEVMVGLADNVISVSPKSCPREGLLAFRRRMWRLFDPWANSVQLDGEVPNLPEE